MIGFLSLEYNKRMIESNSRGINTALIEFLLIVAIKFLIVVITTKLQNIHFPTDVEIAIKVGTHDGTSPCD